MADAESIETERLALAPVGAEHVPLLVALDADPEVMRFLTGGRASTADEVAAVVAREAGHRWVAFERHGGAFVGWFGIPPSGPAEVELGYRLVRSAWGRGLATEGGRAMLEVAFEARGAERLWAQTMTVNVRSRAVLEALGFAFVRTFFADWSDPIDGGDQGDVEYELLQPDRELRRWVRPPGRRSCRCWRR